MQRFKVPFAAGLKAVLTLIPAILTADALEMLIILSYWSIF